MKAERSSAIGTAAGAPRSVLTLNAGSSSLKFAAFEVIEGAPPRRRLKGQVERIGAGGELVLGGARRAIGEVDHAGAVRIAIEAARAAMGTPLAVGHRIVHGGARHAAPALLDDEVVADLAALVDLAPLHQPDGLAAVRAARAAYPNAAQVACFDTAFHRTEPWAADTYAIPQRFFAQGVRRYGFHGLSYEWIAGRLRRDYPELAEGRVVVLHLGNGASACAMAGGRSQGCSMGFSPLGGLPMGTRCGEIDPGVLLYMMRLGMDPGQIEDTLYRRSGLCALSGGESDMRALLASPAPEAARAVGYFVRRVRREVAAMAADLGGIDGLVFTGGIGENAAPIRAAVIEGLGFLGLALDAGANSAGAELIGAGPVAALRLGTDEEAVIAAAAARLVSAA